MSTFVMLTRLSHDSMKSPSELEKIEEQMMSYIREACPEVNWLQSYAVLGPYEYLDIFEAPDVETATKISTIVRTIGHSQAEIWPATEWQRFKDLLHNLPLPKSRMSQAMGNLFGKAEA